jgi:hypothetical protein
MKHANKLAIKIIAAIVIGLFVAYAGVGITHVTRPCTPAQVPSGESITRCEAIAKVYMHPHDLLANKQGKLVRFSAIFVISSLASFGLFSVIGLAQRKRSPASQSKAQ